MATVLIIDDDPAIRDVFSQFLENNGYSVETAAEGKEGLMKMRQLTPDLIITDIIMPGMDGLEVLQHIRNYSRDVPVIAISGGMKTSAINFLPLAKRFGACKSLKKPVAQDALLQAVKELLPSSAKG